MEKYIFIAVFLFCATILAVVLRRIKSWRAKRPSEKSPITQKTNVIKQPRLYLFVGVIGCIVFTSIALFFLLAPGSMIAGYKEDMPRWPLFLIFFAINIPYLLFILVQLNWKIVVNEDEFVFRNIFGKKRVYKYADVSVKQLSRCTRFYQNEKHIVGISFLQDNWDCLEKAIQAFNRRQKISHKAKKKN